MEGEASGEERLNRLLQTHGQEVVGFLMFAKAILSENAYKELVKAAREIVKQSSNPEGGITVQKCEEILSQVFVGQTRVLQGFRYLIEAGDPSHDGHSSLHGALSFVDRVKASSSISNEDYGDFLDTLFESMTKKITHEEAYIKVKKAMRRCPELFQTFETYVPPPLSNEQPCRSPNISISKVLCITPDENHSANHSFDGNEEIDIPWSEFSQTSTRGNGESLYAEENDGDKIDPLPCWSPSRENELPPKVNPDMFTRYTTSYSKLPKTCLTLKTSYRTELGQFIFNDTLVSSTSGSEDCFKFRTKNHYEENIFKCEDDMFESDMLLQRYRTTSDFIRNLQGYVDKDMKIQDHLTPLHRRCIEQLYDVHGLDMLDALSEEIDTSIALVILQSRLNQKIEDLKEARLSLNKACSNIIANNYYRSLDHRSSSFKQLDKRRMSPKALLAEAREINMARLNNGDKHLSACNNQSSLISENVFKDIDLHIHKDIDTMVHYACKSCSSEQKLMMIWTTLVQPFVSIISCQLQEKNDTVAPKEVCEHCGLSKTFLRSIPDSSLANNFSLSSKKGRYLLNTSNKSASILEGQTEIEDSEFIPDVGNIQFGSMLGHWNRAASYDVAARSGDGFSHCRGHSNCDHSNKSEVCYESREGCNIEMGTSAYSKRTAELYDVKGSIPCCSLVVLLRLHQILYERLVVAKNLSAEASKRDSHACDLYAGFKDELFNLIMGSTNTSNFEKYCLSILGPRSYVLFTLNEVIDRVIKQLCKICPVAEDNSILQTREEMRGPATGKDLSFHQNPRTSPGCPTNGSLEQDHQEREKGSKHNDDIVKPMQNHFQRRKKRKLETSPASIAQTGVDNSSPQKKPIVE